ncbi:MAG: hypothetical protein K2L95_04645 [Alphaproteobacteria bacterium]|nr:hypothetical protein [Alphaproteobacteria bacterium]
MFKQLKMKIAARRVEKNKKRTAARRKTNRTAAGFWARAWDLICRPFRWMGRMARRVWDWLRTIDLIGMVNLTLLVSIIVLFSMLIIDISRCGKKTVVVVDADAVPVIVSDTPRVAASDVSPRQVKPRAVRPTLPLRRDVVAAPRPQQVVAPRYNLTGDVVVNGRGDGHMLTRGIRVQGNVYLQNMRKYVLPCDTYIDGNLFLRDVNMLQFCGDFVITGNIYVSRRSSFGPIPSTARLGGQVIL